jgi:hypothetical protein
MKTQTTSIRNYWFAALILVAALIGGGGWIAPAAVASSIAEGNVGISYSGDDLYDPAAGGRPELSVAMASASERSPFSTGISYSGDDPYDPAAGGRPELSVAMASASERSPFSTGISYSGDDPYDPAAGGRPELSVVGLVDTAWRGAISFADLSANPELIAVRNYSAGRHLSALQLTCPLTLS